MPASLNLCLIGCGHMGSALVHGWISKAIAHKIDIVDPHTIAENLTKNPDITHYKNFQDIQDTQNYDCLILAVKPQILEAVCQDIQVPENTLVISIAAGKTTNSLANLFTTHPIIRAMPNTPSAIGKGICALFASDSVTNTHKHIADTLFQACGETVWLDQEEDMNAVTAVSGSGPAYIFLLIETLTQAGIKAGLYEDLATKLARQTVIGSAHLAEQSPDINASTLRESVTSPGGTTEAALKILMDGKLQNIFDHAIEAAQKRSKELSS